MADPYPERRRRDRLDRTDHHRAAQPHGRDPGPSERRISNALEDVATHDVPGTPGLGTLQVLAEIHEAERKSDTRRVRDFSITSGRPRHGALRSDDHIGRYEVLVPFEEVSDDAYAPDCCRECGHSDAVYKYHAHHFIAGDESVWCPECEAKLYGNEWS